MITCYIEHLCLVLIVFLCWQSPLCVGPGGCLAFVCIVLAVKTATASAFESVAPVPVPAEALTPSYAPALGREYSKKGAKEPMAPDILIEPDKVDKKEINTTLIQRPAASPEVEEVQKQALGPDLGKPEVNVTANVTGIAPNTSDTAPVQVGPESGPCSNKTLIKQNNCHSCDAKFLKDNGTVPHETCQLMLLSQRLPNLWAKIGQPPFLPLHSFSLFYSWIYSTFWDSYFSWDAVSQCVRLATTKLRQRIIPGGLSNALYPNLLQGDHGVQYATAMDSTYTYDDLQVVEHRSTVDKLAGMNLCGNFCSTSVSSSCCYSPRIPTEEDAGMSNHCYRQCWTNFIHVCQSCLILSWTVGPCLLLF